MIREFNNEPQAKAIAESLGLLITKYKDIYIVGNNKEEILANYGLGYYSMGDIFYDKAIFEIGEDSLLAIRNKNIVDASSIELPYNIKDCAYMFWGCTSLKVPPVIPEGVKSCQRMFSQCASLKKTSIIPKSVISCAGMFAGCTSLETPPKIPEGATKCYRIFQGCTSLKELPHFPKNCDTYEALQGTPFEGLAYDKRI